MLIDGADVRDVDPVELRQAIAVVDDAPFLFSTTIADNIAYARGGRRARARRSSWPRGARRPTTSSRRCPTATTTRVGERGLTLSGGQRQRVAIARALLADPRILVLDDATSAVDASTEQAIKEALREVMAGRTTFVIAHRLSTIALADEIVVVEDGAIAARGHPRRAAGDLTAVRRDRREGPAGPGLPEPQPGRAGGGGAVRREQAEALSRRDDLRRRLRETGGRGRKLRGILELLRPYRTRTALMFVGLGPRDRRRRWRPRRWPSRRSTRASSRATSARSTSSSSLFIVSALVVWGTSYIQTYLTNWVGQRALQDLRLDIFRHLQEMPVGFYERRPAGVLISRMTNDVEALESMVTDSVTTLFQASLTLIGSIAILLWFDVELALLTFLIFPVMAVGSLAFRLASADAFRRTRETIGALTAYLQETLSGIRVMRSFAQEPRHMGRFAELNAENRAANHDDGQPQRRVLPGGRVRLGGRDGRDPALRRPPGARRRRTVGVLVGFIAALNGFFDPISQLSQVYTTYQSGMAALDKIFALLDEEPDLVDKPGAPDLPRPLRGEIAFEDVTFAYSTAEGDEDRAWRT